VWGEYFQGLIDEVRVYNRALSASEVQSDMNTSVVSAPPPSSSPPPSSNGLMAAFNFNENSGTSVIDRSGHGYNISLTGGATRTTGRCDRPVSFNGTTAYGTVTSFPSLPTWTVSAWVKSPAAPASAAPAGPVHREANFQLSWNHLTPAFRGAAAVNVAGIWY